MMDLVLQILLLLVGFVLLVKGADFFVDGASGIAQMLKIPPLIIGLTIVAMGTSLPEMSVSVSAAIAHKNELAIANAVGSNTFNLMVVCGFCAVLCPLTIQRPIMLREYPISLLSFAMLLVFGLLGMAVGRIEGIIMTLCFAAFLVWTVISAMKARQLAPESEEPRKKLPLWQCLLYIAGGAAAIIIGGDFVVDSASAIALKFGMSENLVGLTIVAFGTSLPELVTSAVAAKKKEVDMALGNVIGSNIFNVLMVLGISAAISPMGFTAENAIDLGVMLGFSLLVWIFCWTSKRLERWEGGIMLGLYAGYVGYICVR